MPNKSEVILTQRESEELSDYHTFIFPRVDFRKENENLLFGTDFPQSYEIWFAYANSRFLATYIGSISMLHPYTS